MRDQNSKDDIPALKRVRRVSLGPCALLDTIHLLPGEEEAEADIRQLDRDLRGDLRPDGPIEHVWVRDILEYTRDVQAARRRLADLLAACAPQGLDLLLSDLMNDTMQRAALVRAWAAGDPDARSEVRILLERAGLSEATITARTLGARITDYDIFQRQIREASQARDALILRLERRRRDRIRFDRECRNYVDNGRGAYPRYIERPDAVPAPRREDARLKRPPGEEDAGAPQPARDGAPAQQSTPEADVGMPLPTSEDARQNPPPEQAGMPHPTREDAGRDRPPRAEDAATDARLTRPPPGDDAGRAPHHRSGAHHQPARAP